MKTLRLCSLFSGIGGIELGFKPGFKIVYANEIDKYACRTYRLNFPPKILIEGDITSIDENTIPDCDILTAGFPCQTFSSVGLKAGFDDSRGIMFFEVLRVLRAKKPQVVFLENVANLLKHDEGNTFKIITSSLEDIGYHVIYKVMNACEYGIPQQRNRIYIIGFLDENKLRKFKFPAPIALKHNAFYYLSNEKQEDNYYMNKHKKIEMLEKNVINTKKIYRFTDWGISSGKEGICPTLLAAMGSPYERIPFFRDEYGIRKLTQRECANLQGFPKDFEFDYKAPKQVYKQIGNSVCVPIIRMLAKEIRKVMEE